MFDGNKNYMVSVINNIMSNIGASKNKGGADHLSYIWLMSLATAQQFATIGWEHNRE